MSIESIEDILKAAKDHASEDYDNFMTAHLKPGDKIEVTWRGDVQDCVDEGYCFTLPGMDAESGEMFVHVPNPDNPGGMDTPPDIFIHLAELAANKMVKKIRAI